MGTETPFGAMLRHLQRLKGSLAAAGITAHVSSPGGGSRTVLRIDDPILEVTCGTNPADGRWWYRLQHKPIAAVEDPAAVAKVIEQIRETEQ